MSGDTIVDLGMMCTDEKDIGELQEMCGPLCWQGYNKDPGGFKKLMWYGIMKEFHYKAMSTLSRCGTREMSSSHKHLSKKKKRKRRHRQVWGLTCEDGGASKSSDDSGSGDTNV